MSEDWSGLEYDAEHRWLTWTERIGNDEYGATAIAAENVDPSFAADLIAALRPKTRNGPQQAGSREGRATPDSGPDRSSPQAYPEGASVRVEDMGPVERAYAEAMHEDCEDGPPHPLTAHSPWSASRLASGRADREGVAG